MKRKSNDEMLPENGQATIQPKSDKNNTHEIKNFRLNYVKEALSGCINTGLSVDPFLLYIDFTLELDELILKRNDSIKILMEGYSVNKVPVGSLLNYDYKDHDKKVEINEKLDAINNLSIQLTPANFIPREEFFQFMSNRAERARRLSMEEIAALSKILMKK